MSNQKKNDTTELLSEIYKNAKMGADSVVDLLPSVKDGQFKTDITGHLGKYEAYAAKAKEMLSEEGVRAEDESAMTKFYAKVGMKMNTMIDSTTSHIAEMMIEGTTMGITDLTKTINSKESKSGACSSSSLNLGKDLLSFEESAVTHLKSYL